MEMTKDAIGISNYRTYSNTLSDLIEWWFIKEIQKSKNQYSSTIIAIVENTKANTKALDKALHKHIQKQSISTVYSTVCIDKQETIEQETINHVQEDKEIQNTKLTKKKEYDYSDLLSEENSFAKEAFIILKELWWNPSMSQDKFLQWIDWFLEIRMIWKNEPDFKKWKMALREFQLYWVRQDSKKEPNYLSKMQNSFSFRFNQPEYAKR
jgi:hypothetical protein